MVPLRFLKYDKHAPASGPLDLLFPLTRNSLPRTPHDSLFNISAQMLTCQQGLPRVLKLHSLLHYIFPYLEFFSYHLPVPDIYLFVHLITFCLLFTLKCKSMKARTLFFSSLLSSISKTELVNKYFKYLLNELIC